MKNLLFFISFFLLLLVSNSYGQESLSLNFWSDSYEIPYGGNTTIYWTTTNATTCLATSGTSQWIGPKQLYGNFLVEKLYNTATFCIVASNGVNNIIACLTIIVQPPHLYIPSRTVGAGTNVKIPLIVNNPVNNFKGFQMSVYDNSHQAKHFQLNQLFYYYQNNWFINSERFDNRLEVAALGNPVYLNNGDKIGNINLKISETPGQSWYPNIVFYDGNSTWGVITGVLTVLDIPFSRYHDPNDDGSTDINDGFLHYDLMGTSGSLSSIINVATDLDGDGFPTDRDLYYFLQRLVNPANANHWPIFSDYYGCGKVVKMEWKKLNNGKWGLFSQDTITNGGLNYEGNTNNISLPTGTNSMFKKVNNKIYFAGQNPVIPGSLILVASAPVTLTGTVNEGRLASVSISSPTSVENEITPTEFSLSQNYPNPFNPTTSINFTLPDNGLVTLKIYDVLGKEVAILVNEEKPAGTHQIKFDATSLPSGLYFYRLQTSSFVETKKMILMK